MIINEIYLSTNKNYHEVTRKNGTFTNSWSVSGLTSILEALTLQVNRNQLEGRIESTFNAAGNYDITGIIKKRVCNKLGTTEEMYIYKSLISLLHVSRGYTSVQTITCKADLYEFQ